ncbi:unnamed protein product [Knipowitschia caucasica]|uniref:Calponin-homology (CH) domain-containing protein n=1 Tax=Knipowitschia caucasica TaxID=637954 RepID=A0AAV2MKL4_KNICA
MDEEQHRAESPEEKTQCDETDKDQITDAALEEKALPKTGEEGTNKEQELEAKTDGDDKGGETEETKSADEKEQSETASEAQENRQDNTRTEDESKTEQTQECTKKEENTPTHDDRGKNVGSKETETKTPKGKDSDVKQDINKKGKTEGSEKPKKKSGPSASALAALSRPRNSARSGRASNKKDLIAKFQQGAPETPVPRNFKLQRSATAGSTGATIKQKILQWCISKTRNYEGVKVENFSSSWCDGMAFCALIHRFFPDAFDFSSLNPKERERNFTLAFQTAETLADCCPLLEVSDMLLMGNHPDPMCVFTYVQSLCHSLSKIEKQRKDSAEKENAANKEEEGAQKETQEISGETEGTKAMSESHETTREEEDVVKTDETDTQAVVEEES